MRVTAIHWQVFLEIAEQFPALITSKFNGPQGKAQGNELWKTVAARLNGLGYGEKTIGEWRRALTDWKSKVKIKASKLRCSSTRTEGGSCDTPPLTDLEQKLLSLMGTKCLEGDDTKELGHSLSKKLENIEKLQILTTDNDEELNLDFEVITEPFATEEYEGRSCLEIPTEHNYASFGERHHGVASPYKGGLEKNVLKRKCVNNVLNNQENNLTGTHKRLNVSSDNTPITTDMAVTSRTVNFKTIIPPSGTEQKRRKISSIPKIGKNLENMTLESVETLKVISKNIETMSKNSSRIADSLEELVVYLKNRK